MLSFEPEKPWFPRAARWGYSSRVVEQQPESQMSYSNWKLRALAASTLLLALVACDSGNAQTSTPAESSSSLTVSPAGEKPAPGKSSHPVTIGQGMPVDLNDHLVPGGYTVFDFTSPYCGPCKKISPYLDQLHAGRQDVTVVKVDINRPGYRGIDFRSPVAQQHRLQQVPYFKVFDAEGSFVSEGEPAWKLVVGWIIELQEQGQAGR
jgi:thiol-disulfide isomerase/thioredoxin